MIWNTASRRLKARQGSNGGPGGRRVAGVSHNKAVRNIAMIVAAARRIITRNGVLQEASRRRMIAFTQRQKCSSVTAAFWTRAQEVCATSVAGIVATQQDSGQHLYAAVRRADPPGSLEAQPV